MFPKFPALALVLSFSTSLLLTPSAVAAAPKADDTEQVMAIYSSFKTFGDLGKWLQAYDLATTEELQGTEAILQKSGLSFKSEMTKGVFTAKRLTWDDIHLAKILTGDWKTAGGRILVAHDGTSFDQLFSQAMMTLDPKSAQRTSLDLLIDTADALPTAQARASAAAGWSWMMRILKTGTSTLLAANFNASRGRVTCGPKGEFVINGGYEGTDKTFGSKDLPDRPVAPELLAAMNAREPGLFKKCSQSNVQAVQSVFEAPGKTPADKVKFSKEFAHSYGPVGKTAGHDNYDDAIRAGRSAH